MLNYEWAEGQLLGSWPGGFNGMAVTAPMGPAEANPGQNQGTSPKVTSKISNQQSSLVNQASTVNRILNRSHSLPPFLCHPAFLLQKPCDGARQQLRGAAIAGWFSVRSCGRT